MIEFNLQYNSISDSWEVTTNQAFATKEFAQEWIKENEKLKAEIEELKKKADLWDEHDIEYCTNKSESKQAIEIVKRLQKRLAEERLYWKGSIVSELEQELQSILKGDTN